MRIEHRAAKGVDVCSTISCKMSVGLSWVRGQLVHYESDRSFGSAWCTV